jgi:hypothetical protein
LSFMMNLRIWTTYMEMYNIQCIYMRNWTNFQNLEAYVLQWKLRYKKKKTIIYYHENKNTQYIFYGRNKNTQYIFYARKVKMMKNKLSIYRKKNYVLIYKWVMIHFDWLMKNKWVIILFFIGWYKINVS